MRDAFGSTFMFKLMIIFIIGYVSFMTIAVSYAKVFRLKNNVINILEQQQYNYNDSADKSNIIGSIDSFLTSSTYNYGDNATAKNDCNPNGDVIFSDNGVCIEPTNVKSKNAVYYTVTMYLVIDLPFFNYTPVIPIKGETELIDLKKK